MMPYGRSVALSTNNFVQPPEPTDNDQDVSSNPQKARRRRRANLYDVVAGRVNSHGFIPTQPYASQYRDTASSSNRPAAPEEVLFRRKGMPIRYEETDRYFAHTSLPPDRPLPSSDLLETIHAYTADFYDQSMRRRGRDDHYSMTGKSLMFMGVLLEEMVKESMGKTGDLVLVDGERESEDECEPVRSVDKRTGRKRANSGLSGTVVSSGEDLESVVKRRKRTKKRRRTRRSSVTEMDTETD